MQFGLPYVIVIILPGLFYWLFSGSFLYGLIIVLGGYFLTRIIFGNLFDFSKWIEYKKTNDMEKIPFFSRGAAILFTQICLMVALTVLRYKGYLS